MRIYNRQLHKAEDFNPYNANTQRNMHKIHTISLIIYILSEQKRAHLHHYMED